MEELERITDACEFIKKSFDKKIHGAVILGSGLGDAIEESDILFSIDYRDIPHFPVPTVSGHKGRLILAKVEERNILFMQGRFHYYEGYSMNEVVFPIRVFSKLGISKLLVTNAAGGINEKFSPGDLMVIDDHINLSMNNPLIGKNIDELGHRFPDMTECYNRKMIDKLKTVYAKNGIHYTSGVYAYLPGPSYETPAEIRMLRIIGADAVGMSTVPEVIAARHCGMEVCGISCITNMAAGVTNKPLNHQEVLNTSEHAGKKFRDIVFEFLKII